MMATSPFTIWEPWTRRMHLAAATAPGVYLLGRFERTPRTRAEPLGQDVICIAATDRPLSERWREFQRVALSGTGNHAEARTFHQQFMRGLHALPDWLHVAALELPADTTAAVKEWLTRAYRDATGKLPACNKNVR